MPRPRRPAWLGFAVASLVTGAALAGKLLLARVVTRDEPVLLFFAAILVSAAYGGLGPGLLATLLGATLDGYFFMRPFNRWALDSADEAVRLGVFVIEGIFISWICARMKRARVDAEDSAEEARELEGQLLEISEAEQRRIGHDLHDGLGQQLTGISLMTRRLQETLESLAIPAAAEASKICDLAKGAIEWTRDLCRSLSPPSLERAGLADALRELLAHAEVIFHVQCHFEQHGDATGIPLAASAHLYRIAQEAISNAVRHGAAKQIRLELDASDEMLMKIMDDGAGVETTPARGNGLGLRIMQYRAQMIGATIQVNRRPEGGTIVTCRYRRPELNHANQHSNQQQRPVASLSR